MDLYSTYPELHDWSLCIRCSFVSYQDAYYEWGSYLSGEMQSAYSTAPAGQKVGCSAIKCKCSVYYQLLARSSISKSNSLYLRLIVIIFHYICEFFQSLTQSYKYGTLINSFLPGREMCSEQVCNKGKLRFLNGIGKIFSRHSLDSAGLSERVISRRVMKLQIGEISDLEFLWLIMSNWNAWGI